MKKDTWKTIIQIAISILTALVTTLGVTSCMPLTASEEQQTENTTSFS